MTLELRIPISPTPSFLNQTLLLIASVRRFYPDALARVYIGQAGGATPEAAQRVAMAFSGKRIGFEWLGATEFAAWEGTRSPYLATMNRRWKTPIDGDHVLILDADVVCEAPFPELFEADAVQGVQAHVAPLPTSDFQYLFAIDEVRPIPRFTHVYSGNNIMGPPDATGPFYPNSGFVFAPRALFERLIEPYHEAIWRMRHAMKDTYWFDQLAVALAVAKAGVPCKSLPPRFNFPNQPAFDAHYPGDLADLRVLHYLRTDVVDRTRDFADLTALRRFTLRTDLTGSNERLRQTIEHLRPILAPPELTRAEDAPWA